MQLLTKKIFRPLVFLFVLSSWMFVVASQPSQKSSSPIDFTLQSVKGDTVRLQDYHGKYVLINVWATWCGPCRAEIPDLVRIRHKYREKGFEILGVVVASKPEDVKEMVNYLHIDYPVLWGTQQALAQFGEINAIPRTFLLDPKGYIVEDILGSRDFQFFDNLLQKYFPEK